VLIQQLKQLEADALVLRDATENIPPVVHYSLMDAELAFKPVLFAMAVWAIDETEMPVSKKPEDFPGDVL